MPKVTKTQAKKRLIEAYAKLKSLYINGTIIGNGSSIVTTSDMAAFEKIIDKCLKRCQ